MHSVNTVDYCKMYRKYCIGELCSVCPGTFDDIKVFGTDPDWNGALEETPKS